MMTSSHCHDVVIHCQSELHAIQIDTLLKSYAPFNFALQCRIMLPHHLHLKYLHTTVQLALLEIG